MQRISSPALMVLAILAFSGTPAARSDETGSFTHEGHILLQTAEGKTYLSGASENYWWASSHVGRPDRFELNGLDGYVVALPASAAGNVLALMGDSALPHDLDLVFYDADAFWLAGGDCISPSPGEVCAVPEGAAYAAIRLSLGFDTAFRLSVE